MKTEHIAYNKLELILHSMFLFEWQGHPPLCKAFAKAFGRVIHICFPILWCIESQPYCQLTLGEIPQTHQIHDQLQKLKAAICKEIHIKQSQTIKKLLPCEIKCHGVCFFTNDSAFARSFPNWDRDIDSITTTTSTPAASVKYDFNIPIHLQ